MYTDKQTELDNFLKKFVPEKRLIHSAAVSEMAAKLAAIYGEDVDKARFAGMYHDIAKGFSEEDSNRLVREFGLSGEKYFNNRAISHSKLGAAILENYFGVTDRDILDGVANHTTGRPGMSLFEQIIFVADATDATRTYNDVQYYRDLAEKDIDEACLEIMDFNIKHVISKGKTLDTDTITAREYIIDKIRSR